MPLVLERLSSRSMMNRAFLVATKCHFPDKPGRKAGVDQAEGRRKKKWQDRFSPGTSLLVDEPHPKTSGFGDEDRRPKIKGERTIFTAYLARRVGASPSVLFSSCAE
ncbi:hypothetical protein DBV15_02464 [Temnothorax longispinosus]|uniref:Uncharacterized protein n=1 Tax=Temnothorax longispinosus TaxID=300112 RepID=A0A4S2KVQ7_9HYME|nr:hypothetical protein DBV15_02464 [Temnothorax longispinosus]